MCGGLKTGHALPAYGGRSTACGGRLVGGSWLQVRPPSSVRHKSMTSELAQGSGAEGGAYRQQPAMFRVSKEELIKEHGHARRRRDHQHVRSVPVPSPVVVR